jgi:hypothetical protein
MERYGGIMWNPKRTDLGESPGLADKKPAANRLRCGTAVAYGETTRLRNRSHAVCSLALLVM